MLPHLLQHPNKDISIPLQNAIKTPDPNTIRDLITKEHQKAIRLSQLHQGIDLTRSLCNLAAFIVNKTISSSTAQPSKRRRNSKTFGNCYSRIKKG
jgi:hypothetical protein